MLNEAIALSSRALTIEPAQVILVVMLVAILIVGIRRRRKAAMLRAELDRMSARIAALEAAEDQRLLLRVKSGPLAPEHVPETIRVSTQPTEAPGGRGLAA